MKKILIFEPWHLGDVAVALSVIRHFTHLEVEFGLVCNQKWSEWALSTNIPKKVIAFTPPWTRRKRKDKYNPLNYSLNNFLKFRKDVLEYKPDVIIDLRRDIRATIFLKLLLVNKTRIVSSGLSGGDSVYRRRETVQRELNADPNKSIQSKRCNNLNIVTLFFGAADFNRTLPEDKAILLAKQLHGAGFIVNVIFQPSDELTNFEKLKMSLGLNNLNLHRDSLVNIAEVIQRSGYVISTDSGWLHIAFFYGINTIGLFGYDTIKTWRPPGSHIITPSAIYPARYRYKDNHQHFQPLKELNISEVVKFILDLRSSKS